MLVRVACEVSARTSLSPQTSNVSMHRSAKAIARAHVVQAACDIGFVFFARALTHRRLRFLGCV
jgi:hypothetical protein